MPLISWDTCDLYYEDEEGLTVEPDFTDVAEAFVDFTDNLTTIVREFTDKYNLGNKWLARGYNMGWRNLSGYKVFTAEDGDDFLQAVTPKCDYTLQLFEHKNGLFMYLSHHDSPTGETYLIEPLYNYLDRTLQYNDLTILAKQYLKMDEDFHSRRKKDRLEQIIDWVEDCLSDIDRFIASKN